MPGSGPAAPVGVLVMAYGTPATTDDIEAYYTHIRRGNAPSPELLAELTGRYEAIGGTSPLLELTRAQASGLAGALGPGYVVELGMKHAPPFIEDGVATLAARGVSKVVGLVLAPHYSRLSVGQYEARAVAAAAEAGVELDMVRSWHLSPGYLDLLATFVEDAVDSLKLPRPDVEVLFTAHSLPDHVLMDGDPYADQLRETAVMVAARARVQRWSVAWQSAGRTSEPWIGPDILAVFPSLVVNRARGVVVCAAGFTSDHLEILYDLDIEAKQSADAFGLGFARTPMPNDHPDLMRALAEVVLERA